MQHINIFVKQILFTLVIIKILFCKVNVYLYELHTNVKLIFSNFFLNISGLVILVKCSSHNNNKQDWHC